MRQASQILQVGGWSCRLKHSVWEAVWQKVLWALRVLPFNSVILFLLGFAKGNNQRFTQITVEGFLVDHFFLVNMGLAILMPATSYITAQTSTCFSFFLLF